MLDSLLGKDWPVSVQVPPFSDSWACCEESLVSDVTMRISPPRSRGRSRCQSLWRCLRHFSDILFVCAEFCNKAARRDLFSMTSPSLGSSIWWVRVGPLNCRLLPGFKATFIIRQLRRNTSYVHRAAQSAARTHFWKRQPQLFLNSRFFCVCRLLFL